MTRPLAAEPAKSKWLQATAYAVPKETATEGEGYFSIIEGHNGRLYIGTHANGVNSWLVEFDPKTKKMKIVVDATRRSAPTAKGFGAQAKIHTRNNVGASGKIYFGTKQGYPDKNEKREDYPGGYPMVYDPKTGKTKVYPIPVPHQGINSITPDEIARRRLHLDLLRPPPRPRREFALPDPRSEDRQVPRPDRHQAHLRLHRRRSPGPGLPPAARRRHRPLRPEDGQARTAQADHRRQAADAGIAPRRQADGHPINWDISPDGKTLYCAADEHATSSTPTT